MLTLRLWRIAYRLVLLVARPWVHVRLYLRGRSEPEYRRRISERFGFVPAGLPEAPVWFHTVSAGETIAAAPLIRRLTQAYPDRPFLVTTMTPTGSAQVEKLLGERVAHCYAPYDFPDAVSRFFERLAPRMLVLMETELWPNMLEQARARSVPALLVNARLSERSARGYARVGALTRRMLDSLDFIACQYPDHADRFASLGAARERLDALGSVKFDVSLPADHEPRCAELAARWNLADRPVWIAASTHSGEEALVLEAHQRIRSTSPDAVLILVPRHPNRADEVERLIGEAGFDCTRMSASVSVPVGTCPGEVILGDTMGELLYLYGLSQVAFVGGSLVPVGGHNPIEAAVCGQPLVMGPELRNFADVAAAFRAAGCLELVDGAQELAAVVGGYLSSPTRRSAAAGSALAVVAANTGATERLFQLLRARLDGL